MRNNRLTVPTLALCALMLLAGCANTAAVPQPEASPTPTAALDATPDPVVPVYRLRDYNSRGWYSTGIDQENDTWRIQYFDFAAAQESFFEMPITIQEGGHTPQVFVDEQNLYVLYCGGAMRSAKIFRRPLTGGDWECLLDLPEGSFVSGFTAPLLSDGQALYFLYCMVSTNPAVVDPFQIARLDMNDHSLTVLTDWEGIWRGQIYGAWEQAGQILYIRRELAEDCPIEPEIWHYHVENVRDLEPWITTVLYALDPRTGEETPLRREPGLNFQWDYTLYGDALYSRDIEAGTLTICPLDGSAGQDLAIDSQAGGLLAIYPNDLFFIGDRDGRRTLYVYNRQAGELAPSPLYRLSKGEDSCVTVICPAGEDEYLIVRDSTIEQETRLGMGESDFYTATIFPLQYEIITREGLLDESIPGRPVQLLEGHEPDRL